MRVLIWLLSALVAGLFGFLIYDNFVPQNKGKVVVISEPAGAWVFIDLEPTKVKTNSEPIELSAGEHTISIRQDGFASNPNVIVHQIKSDQIDTLRFKLVMSNLSEYSAGTRRKLDLPPESDLDLSVPPANPPTSAQLRGIPVDSSFLKRNPKTTPTETSTAYPVFPFLPIESTPTMTDTSGSQEGKIEIGSSISGATVFVNDQQIPEATPAIITLPPGTHTVKVSLAGYVSDPDEHTVKVKRQGSTQFVFFTLTKAQDNGKQFRVITTPVKGEILVNNLTVGEGEAVVAHKFGVYNISFGKVEGYKTPDPIRLTVTPSNPSPEVKGVYSKAFYASATVISETNISLEGGMKYRTGVYFEDTGAQISENFGPKPKQILETNKFGWEMAMGQPNHNPTGGDFVEFIFNLPDEVSPDAPMNFRLYLYRSSKKYPLTLSGRSEFVVTVNGKTFLDGFQPRYKTDAGDLDRYEEWSLQKTLVAGENRIMIRTGEGNSVYNYLRKIEIL